MDSFELLLFLLLAGVVLFFFSIQILRRESNAIWLILLLLISFPLSLSPDNFGFVGRASFDLRIRYGGLNPVEWLMLWITVLIFIKAVIEKKPLRFQFITDPALRWIFIIFTLGMFHGAFRRLIAPYGETPLFAPFGSYSPIFSIFFMTTLVQNTIKTPEELFRSLRIYWYFLYLIITYGIILLILFFLGIYKTFSIEGSMPIILYEQLLLFFYPIAFLIISRRLELPKFWSSSKIAIFLMIFFILISTRRLEYISAVTIPIIAYSAGKIAGIFPKRHWSVPLKRILITIPVILFLYYILPLPGKDIIYKTILSLDLGSQYGNLSAAANRLGQFNNLFLNIHQGYTFIFGLGLGTFWKEIIPVAHSLGSGFFNLIEQGYTSFPQFHIPIVSLLFRFGYLGTAILLCIFIWYFKNIIRIVRVLPNIWCQAHYLSMSAFVWLFLLFLGDTRSPSMAYVGIVLGFAETIKTLANKYPESFTKMTNDSGHLF